MPEIPWPLLGRFSLSSVRPNSTRVEREVEELFRELRVPLLRYLAAIGLPVTEAEDIVQDVFLALYRHLEADKPRDNLHGWIYRVARNLALKQMRRRRAAGDSGAEALTIPDGALNPEQHAASKQEDGTMKAVIAALPELDRQCLLLRAEGLRYREIAHALDISLGSVALSLGRALGRLARALRVEIQGRKG